MKTHGLRNFIKLCLATQNEKELSLLLDLFLTDEEKDSISLRFLIVKELLKQEKPQRVIAEDLKVSIAKITRGSNELKRTPAKLIQFLRENI